ncbi:MAG: serine/threonine-protein kinase [Prosthecobacter sp.]
MPDLLRAFGWEGRFELLDRIGTGAMGQVWLARERQTEKAVALKMLDPSRVGDEQTLARLDIEASTLLKLREAGAHANVVPILDFKLTDSHACLVMEFIPGSNLKKWCEAHQLDLQERVRLVADVARACGWFHALGVVHRDLKPANILVNATTRQPVIVDFSIAKVQDGLPITLTNEALGTAPYMAPEQLDRSRGHVTPATDVYALGATLYELLTQVHPHPGDLAQIIRRHSDEVRPASPSALNPAVPRDLECVVLKALSHRPADRYPDGKSLADDLERFLAGQPVMARPLSRMTYLVRQARRKPALTLAIAACIGFGLVALGNGYRQHVEREVHALESGLATAMQDGEWNAKSLAQAQSVLVAMERREPELAEKQRQLFHSDVVHDVELRLQQNHLQDSDFEWLDATSMWLGAELPAESARLKTLITERKGRWETWVDLRAPFDALPRLFPGITVREEGGVLRPDYSEKLGAAPMVMVTDEISVPMEMSATFLADPVNFRRLALDLTFQESRATAYLYRVSEASGGFKKRAGFTRAAPDSFVFFISHNNSSQQVVIIPDSHLLDMPLHMTLLVERDWAEAEINGQWRVRMDVPFALGSSKAGNQCRIIWPKNVALEQLTLRTRRSDATSPLEEADILASQAKWASARKLYENLIGDPAHGVEAEFKLAECLHLTQDTGAAVARWEHLAAGPPSQWRDRAIFRLWISHATSTSGLAQAAPWLRRITEPLPPSLQSQIQRNDAEFEKIESAYASAGMCSALPRVEADVVTDALKAYRLLGVSPMQTGSRFALAHHSAGLDIAAQELFRAALAVPDASLRDPKDLQAVINCLEQWCRLKPVERRDRLGTLLRLWHGSLPENPSVQTIWHMEEARRAARTADLGTAIAEIRATRPFENADNRVLTSAWLLEGMLLRMQGDEDEAQSAWQKAREIARTVTMKHPMHLCDRVLLHSLTQSWDLRSAGEVLTTLAGRHLSRKESADAQAAFNQVFLSDPAWLATFNAVLQDERGRKFAEDYALCREPPRELVLQFYRMLFEQHFLSTAFPQAGREESDRVHSIADRLVTEMAMNPRGEFAHLLAYLRAWADPAAGDVFGHAALYSPELVGDLQWLLGRRREAMRRGADKVP